MVKGDREGEKGRVGKVGRKTKGKWREADLQ